MELFIGRNLVKDKMSVSWVHIQKLFVIWTSKQVSNTCVTCISEVFSSDLCQGTTSNWNEVYCGFHQSIHSMEQDLETCRLLSFEVIVHNLLLITVVITQSGQVTVSLITKSFVNGRHTKIYSSNNCYFSWTYCSKVIF